MAGVERYVTQTQRPRRQILAWGTGCGKTAAAIKAVEGAVYKDLREDKIDKARLPYLRILIVTPAIVRRHWLRECQRWSRSFMGPYARVIEWGRERNIGRTLAEMRDDAYSATIQVVSYDLLGEVNGRGWHTIIFDELHHLANPKSKQSKRAEMLMSLNPEADILGLTATLIPTEVMQIYNPLRLMMGEAEWGRPYKDGGISWDFKGRYCHVDTTEYGSTAWGVREDRIDELRTKLKPIAHELQRESFALDLPPLDLALYELPMAYGHTSTLTKHLFLWVQEMMSTDDISHVVVLVHHKSVAVALRDRVVGAYHAHKHNKPEIVYIDGTVPVHKRDMLLAQCAQATRAILIGTHDSLNEGIRMMWPQQVAIAEWSRSPGRVTQLLGRFNSIGSQARPHVNLMHTEEDIVDAQELLRRVKDVASLLQPGKTDARLGELLGEIGLSPEALAEGWQQMFDNQVTFEANWDSNTHNDGDGDANAPESD